MKSERLASRHLVLLGLGHTNAHIVRMWAMHPRRDTDLTCISDRPMATYSGMLPAVLAGQIPQRTMQIDLVRLCAAAGARFIVGRVVGIDRAKHEVVFEDRPAIPYHALSIGIGSVPSMSGVQLHCSDAGICSLLRIKPMQTFMERLDARLRQLESRREAIRVVIVGSGVAGIEILFCLRSYLRKRGHSGIQLHLVTRSLTVLPGEAAATRRRVEQELESRGEAVTLGKAVVEIGSDFIGLENGQRIEANVVIWATGASPPPLLDSIGLPRSQDGFLATDRSLRVLDPEHLDSGHPIFAVGDTGTIVDEQLPKAGVYAVRQGPVLWNNLNRSISGKPLKEYSPQSDFLRLINLGDGRAIGQWKGWAFVGKWAYWLKHRIDSSFIDKFELKPMMLDDDPPMQCRGCGCKLGAGRLEAAIANFDDRQQLVRDDAAPIGGKHTESLFASTDFFTSPFDDAYLTGRITALHSASDLVAMGARVSEALANVVLPEGDPESQQRMLSDFMAGAAREFHAMGAEIVGGHTITGPRMEAGFTVIGSPITQHVLRKSGLQLEDRLYLTKPIGTGVLLAAMMRAKCKYPDYEALIYWMLQDQAAYARIAVEAGVSAATDITGFGLAGHLLEMLEGSQLAARLNLHAVPLMNGAKEYATEGIESSLLGENLKQGARVRGAEALESTPEYRLLFDPQTCGGLLLGISAESESRFLKELEAAGLDAPSLIGIVQALDADGLTKIHLS